MNCALLLSGNLRTFENNLSIYRNIIEYYNCDIFIFLSVKKFNLHPFKKDLYNFYTENMINDNMLYNYIKILFNDNLKGFEKNVKHIKIYDKVFENNIHKQSKLFSNNKKFIGRDIFSSNVKKFEGIRFIKNFELTNNIRYNYIIVTRCDINELQINSFPQFPLESRTIHISKDNNDVITIANSSDFLYYFYEKIISLFYNNDTDFESVHSMYEHAYKIINSKVYRKMLINIDNDYNNFFDTNITLVSCFYNINRNEWKNYYRSNDKYFENCENILNKKNPVIIFTSKNYNDRILNIRKIYDPYLIYTKIINIDLKDLPMYKYKEDIEKIQNSNLFNIPMQFRDCPEFCKSLYNIVIYSKVYFLKLVSEDNYFISNIFQWIDFGLHNSCYANNSKIFPNNYFSNIFYKNNKIRLVGFNNINDININDRKKYYNSHNDSVCGGLIGGNKYSINKIYELFNNELLNILNMNLINQEQYIIQYILKTNPDLFDFIKIDSWDNLVYNYHKNTVNIALAFSGHLRSFDLCYKNIKTNIIDIINNNNLNIKLFLSSWDNIGFRDDNFNTEVIDINNSKFRYIKEIFSKYNFEKKLSINFYNKYKSDNYLKYKNLCNINTFGTAASMLYKMNSVYSDILDSSENFDIIIRIRPDIIYHNKLDIQTIKDCLNFDKIFMPEFHNKYHEVTKEMMDHFFYGNHKTMKHLLTTYLNIDELIKTECPHTAEGLLSKQIEINKVEIERFPFSYSCIYKNNNIFKVI